MKMKIQNLSIIALALLCSLGFQTAFAAECGASAPLFAGGAGALTDPYKISTPQQLQNLNRCLGESYKNNYYVLTHNLDLSSDFGLTNWTPIGQNSSNAFSGKLNGNGKTVSGLKISNSSDYVGLFGYVSSGAEIKKIHITGDVSGKDYVGLIAGYNKGTISSSYVKGKVSGNQYVGSLAGYNEGTIIDCYAIVPAVVGSGYVGGLAGFNKGGGTVKNSYFVGSVTPVLTTSCFISGCYVSSNSTVNVPPPTYICGSGNARFSYTNGNGPFEWNNSLPTDGKNVVVSMDCNGNPIECGTIHAVKTVADCLVASSSSSVPCDYESSWCDGKIPTFNPTTKPTTGQCVFVSDYSVLTLASTGTNKIFINGTPCEGTSTKCASNKPPKIDGGYYIYVQTGAISSQTANYSITEGSPNCEYSFANSSSSSSPQFITLGLNPGRNTSELNFNWYSGTGTDKSFVRLLKNGDSIYFTGTSGTASTGYRYHKATVTGLEPGTEYKYWVSNDGTEWSQKYTFKTPKPGPFIFAAVADVQPSCGNVSGTTACLATTECADSVIGAWQNIAKKIDEAKAALIVNAGDHAEYGCENEYRGYFSPKELRSIPTAPIVGNHDDMSSTGRNFNYHFNLPNIQQGGATYSNSISNNYYFLYNRVLFIGLNTAPYPSTSSPAEKYISDFKATIKAAKTAHSPLQYDFIVVTHHKSTNSITNCTNDACSSTDPKSAGHTLDSDIIAYVGAGLQELMTKEGVDLVLTGHNHLYVRSKLMYNDTLSENDIGTLYLTLKPASITRNYAGAYDIGYNTTDWNKYVNSYPFIKDFYETRNNIKYYVPISYKIHSRYGTTTATNGDRPGYSIIEVSNRVMTIKSYEQDGTTIFDVFSITPNLPKF
jgi:hypothetical protein